MNDIDKMPSKCQGCPYWEVCEYPYICDEIKPKQHENGNINAESAENLQNRSANGDLISRQAAIDAMLGDKVEITNVIRAIGNERDFEVLNTTCDRHAEIIKALPPVQPKHGEWEYHSNPTIGINPEDAYCSCCGFHVDTTGNIDFDEYNFCPHCGVKMER